MTFPEELKYTKDHQWIKIDGETIIMGVTDFAQSELGDIVYVDVDTLDDELSADDVYGSIEAVKTVSDLFIAVNGEVVEFNEALEADAELINEDPYGKGWIIKVKPSDINDVETLLDAEAYKSLVGA